MTSVEYAVEYAYQDGATFVGAPVSLATARLLVDLAGSYPCPVRVMVRDVPEWRPYEGEQR